ncbi:MAG TPA: DUF4214 domain-containing protein, partial [Bryobacteraceae bacterium]|nr:DUF4214 domain-containing protein [Bryobacteraceae bacterium]
GMGILENLQDQNSYDEISSTPAIADIDLDGVLEAVWTVPGLTGTASVVVAKLGAVNATMIRSWPEWRRGGNRNGVFAPLLGVVQGYESANNLNIYTQVFSGRSPLASVVVDASAIGGSAALMMSDTGTNGDPVANDGRFAAVVNVAATPAGRYSLPVRVTDASGHTDTQQLIYVRRASGGGRVAVIPGSVSFGNTRQNDPLQTQFKIANIGDGAVTINSIVSNSSEFIVAAPAFPQTVPAGGVAAVTLRFRPGSAVGARSGSLTISSTDPSAPVRTVPLTGSTDFGAQAGCSYSLSPGQTLGIPYTGLKLEIQLTASSPSCQWQARSNQNWAQIFPLSGTGSTTLTYTIFPNYSRRPRTALANIAGSIYSAAQNAAVGTPDQRFVAQLYFLFFGRVPAQSEIDFQVNNGLAGGRAALIRAFFNTPEFNLFGRYVAGVYVGLLNRDAEYDGWLFQRNAMALNIINQLQLVTNILNSAEYQQTFGNLSNEDYVRQLYRQILGREASQADVQFQAGALAGISRAQLASNFLNSEEFRQGTGPRLTAFLLYALILQRDPTPEERALRISQIASGADLTALMAELLASSEFSALLL